MLLAGSFILVVGILNGRVARALGEPLHVSVLLFGVAILLAITVAVLAGRGLPNIGDFRQLQPVEYLAGFVVAFCVISATALAEKIGVANFIVVAVSAQITLSLLIDHFDLFGAPIRPVNLLQLGGASMLLGGLVIAQLANGR
ncbi:DMT family transporter [Alphaproteobacteria bacterium]|nr:DMT family transporter [Alphaproteobacteria bacterium]